MAANDTMSFGNLYEMNKMLIEQVDSPMHGKKLHKAMCDVLEPFFKEKLEDYTYFMLLCHEKRDYTILKINNKAIDNIIDTIKECITNRGSVYTVNNADAYGNAIEFWIKYEEQDLSCYFLFPYDEGIVEV